MIEEIQRGDCYTVIETKRELSAFELDEFWRDERLELISETRMPPFKPSPFPPKVARWRYTFKRPHAFQFQTR